MLPIRDHNPTRGPAYATWGIMAVCILAFAAEALSPEKMQEVIVRQYAFIPVRLSFMLQRGFVDTGVVGTIFTSMFMHGGLAHIAGNLWFLRIFGDNVEDNFGRGRYVFFYLASGVAAALAQWVVDPRSQVPMVGASGAIAGVLAAYLVLYPTARVTTLVPIVFLFFAEIPAFVVIALWFAMQFLPAITSLGTEGHGGVAYWAHVGGFVAGLVLAVVFRRPTLPPAHRGPSGWQSPRSDAWSRGPYPDDRDRRW